MADIKDLVGLGVAIPRLAEVVMEGIGFLTKPILTLLNAKAKAYEISVVSKAIAESQEKTGDITYDDGKVRIESSGKNTPDQLPEASLETRANSRAEFQEARRQSNIESIVKRAAEEFDGSEDIGTDRPDSDWIARFFRIAEDITTEQMQALWGKVLAGEVKRPGSFSLRTLDVLKNISQKEADIFVRLARIAVQDGSILFIPDIDNESFLEKRFGIRSIDLILLREIGLIGPSDMFLSLATVKEATQFRFTIGSTCVVIDRPAGTPNLPVPALFFTEVGRELHQFVERDPADLEYVEQIARPFQFPGVVARSGIVVQWYADGTFDHNDLQDVPGNKPMPVAKGKPRQ